MYAVKSMNNRDTTQQGQKSSIQPSAFTVSVKDVKITLSAIPTEA
jgi:hypothetical protein